MKNLVNLILKRVVGAIFLLFALSFFVFLAMYLLPTDVTTAMFARPEGVSVAIKAKILHNLGLDRPFLDQYFSWLFGIFHGNFGSSLIDNRTVLELFSERFFNSLILNGLNLALIAIFGLIFGIISALWANRLLDHVITFLSFSFFCMPSFWTALVFIMIFSVNLGWFPTSGLHDLGDDSLKNRAYHIILPLFVLFVSHIGIYIRLIRSSFLNSMNQSFIQASFARGMDKFSIYKTALKYSLTPVITYFGTTFATILTGSYLIESVFAYPGLGELAISSILSNDYPVVMAIILVTAVFAVVGNLFAEILCILINRGQKR